MNLLFEPLPVFFMHVVKTGGMALGAWLRTNYGRGYVDVGARRLARYTLAELQQFRCYHSWHYGQGMLDLIGRTDLATMTMLRDPVERTVSGFLFGRRINQRAEQPLAELQELLRRALPHLQANVQTRMLGKRADYTAFLRQDTATERETPPIPGPLDRSDRTPPPFAAASAWLDDMSIVGLTERYTESVILMADLLGLPVPARFPSANVNPQRTTFTMRYCDLLDADIVAQLEELDRWDRELYAQATELFAAQWARYQARPQRTYSIAAHIRPRLRPLKADVKRVIRPRPRQNREGA